MQQVGIDLNDIRQRAYGLNQREQFNHQFGVCYVPDQKQILPLEQLNYNVILHNGFHQVDVIQIFQNQSEEVIELYYIFSILPSAVFHQMEIQLEEKKYYGIIKEYEEAKQIYNEGMDQGKGMAMASMSSIHPDILTVKVGNILPNRTIQITLSYFEPLKNQGSNFWRLDLPYTFNPRYNLLSEQQLVALSKLYNTGQVMPQIKSLDIRIMIKLEDQINFMECSSHKIQIQDKEMVHCQFIEKADLSKDFTLLFSTQKINQPIIRLYHTNEDALQYRKYCASVTFVPNLEGLPNDDAYQQYLKNHDIAQLNQYQICQSYAKKMKQKMRFIFLLDRSGSMSGFRIAKAKQALILFLQSLPKQCEFNVVSFGSDCQEMYSKPQPYNEKNIKDAIKKVSNMEANLGGTEMLKPLQKIFHQYTKDTITQLFLLTDGEVTPDPIISIVAQNCTRQNKCYTLGIGSGCSRYLIEQVASAGRGLHSYADDGDKYLDSKIIDLLTDSMVMQLEQVSIDINQQERINMILPDPSEMKQIRANQPFNLLIFLDSQFEGELQIAFKGYNPYTEQWISSQLSVQQKNSMESISFHKIGAKRQMDILYDNVLTGNKNILGFYLKQLQPITYQDLVNISISNQILSRVTAFICETEDLDDQRKAQLIQRRQQMQQDNNKVLKLAQLYRKDSAKGCCGGGDNSGYVKQQQQQNKNNQESMEKAFHNDELLQVLSFVQADGDFKIEKSLLKILGITSFENEFQIKQQFWICILVLSWLEYKQEKNRRKWIMIFNKTICYLSENQIDYYQYRENAIKIFREVH